MILLVCIIITGCNFFYAEGHSKEIKASKEKLYEILTFIDEKYYEFNFDGLFGVILAEAQLLKIKEYNITEYSQEELEILLEKCHGIKRKIVPLLPSNPPYMITFRNKLLNEDRWKSVIRSNFHINEIAHLSPYVNWTEETILQKPSAIYKGVKSDFCLLEILKLSEPHQPCYVSSICREMMLNKTRLDTGYLLTHRLLFLLISKLQQCSIRDGSWTEYDYIIHFCSYIYKETKTSEYLGFPYHDLFMEQVLLCGLEGIEDFLSTQWLYEIMKWQNPHGCYESIGQRSLKRTSNIITFGCSDHSTGLAAATMTLYLRYKLLKLEKMWND